MNDSKLNGIYVLEEDSLNRTYGPKQRAEIERLINISAGWQSSTSILDNLYILNNEPLEFQITEERARIMA